MSEAMVSRRGGKSEGRYGWKKNVIIDGAPTNLVLGAYNPQTGSSSNGRTYYVSNNISVTNGIIQLVSPTTVITDYASTSIGKYCTTDYNTSVVYKTTGTITNAYDGNGIWKFYYMSAVPIGMEPNNIQTICVSDNPDKYPDVDFVGGFHYDKVT